jgi:leucyl-tRNA synthetase
MFGEDFAGFNAQEEAAHPHPHPPPTATEDDPDRASTQGTADGAPSAAKQSEGARVDKAKKGKVSAKATGLQYQFQIMESIGVPREEIKKFADPYYWLEYFPPICIVHLLLYHRHCGRSLMKVLIGGPWTLWVSH